MFWYPYDIKICHIYINLTISPLEMDTKSKLEPEPKEKGPSKIIFVDFVKYMGSKRKRRKREIMALTEAEFEDMLKEKKDQAQLSLFG